ncbi:hypothetical protein JSY14_06955 [Brachybacterium sp. EF45031]|uniref:hypothetical protein n=1 Tax=Brachybacterium sillae TaxID=2810536 RepID=UPI00217EF835|nr:hypothetical protein [Brachybacterium sillae]MCS6711773.1 hypothetical protein [Brachybacterium sillae]
MTVPATPDDLWQQLLADWLPLWLGTDTIPQMVGAPLHRRGSVRGRVVGCHVGRRLRLRWTPPTLDHETEIDVALESETGGTAVRVHQDRLLGPAERQDQLLRWESRLRELTEALGAEQERLRQREAEGI